MEQSCGEGTADGMCLAREVQKVRLWQVPARHVRVAAAAAHGPV